MHGPSAGPLGLTAVRASRSSRRGYILRRALRDGRVVIHSALVGGGRARDVVAEGGGGGAIPGMTGGTLNWTSPAPLREKKVPGDAPSRGRSGTVPHAPIRAPSE